jgi:hypothetical protein
MPLSERLRDQRRQAAVRVLGPVTEVLRIQRAGYQAGRPKLFCEKRKAR